MNEVLSISGDNLLHALDYVKRKKGLEGLNWVVNDTGQDMKDIYPDKMYPLKKYLQLLESINDNFEHIDPTIISRIGFDRAKTLSIFEYHKKKTDPITIFNMVQRHWSRFNGFGRLEVRKTDDSYADIYVCNYPGDPLYCQRMGGFIKGIIVAVCDKKDAKVEEVKCLSRGDKYCKFEASWR